MISTATQELFREDGYLQTCEAVVVAVDGDDVILDRTVFYPDGGGQPGDRGELRCGDGRRLAVVDTRKREDGVILHRLAEGDIPPAPAEAVTACIDWDRRYRLMRMHSCMHLLCAAVPYGVTGGQIHDGRGRLDFDAQDGFDREALQAELNRLVAGDHPMRLRWISDAELDAQPELVRTMSVQPPRGSGRVRLVEFAGVDLQPCGGTHVRSTAEIGPVRIQKIEKKGKHNRRVTVVFDE